MKVKIQKYHKITIKTWNSAYEGKTWQIELDTYRANGAGWSKNLEFDYKLSLGSRLASGNILFFIGSPGP